jgi:predicted DNA-binding protein (UPF0278 family)
MKVAREKRYKYLSMILDYCLEEKLKVDIECYINNIVEEFLEDLNSKAKAS